MIEIIGNTPLEIVILLSAKTFALSAEFEVNKLPAAHKIKQAAKIIWDRNTRETVKPPIGLRKSKRVFSAKLLHGFNCFFPWSFKWNKDVSSNNVQSLLNQCSFHETMMFASFKRSFSVLTFSVLFGVKNCCNADTPYLFFFSFLFFCECACVRLSSAFFIVCVSRCGERKVCQP